MSRIIRSLLLFSVFGSVGLGAAAGQAATWAQTGSLGSGREGHTATVLRCGRVLVAGGWGEPNNTTVASAEIYDPGFGTFSATSGEGVDELASQLSSWLLSSNK